MRANGMAERVAQPPGTPSANDVWREGKRVDLPEPAPFLLGQRIGFILLPYYSFGALAAAVEPLRLANLLSSGDLYSWKMLSVGGKSVSASNGIATIVDGPIQTPHQFDTIIICGGSDLYPTDNAEICQFLRRWYTQGLQIGALSSGAALLAKAGLLANRRATIHWASTSAFREIFPDVILSDRLFEIDPPIFTAGAAEGICDLMLHFIRARCGRLIASQVSNHLSHPIMRGAADRQVTSISMLLGARHKQLDQILHMMEDNVEEPLSYHVLSARSGLSLRQMQRLFKRHLDITPAGYYRKLRLQRARYLLLQTSMSVTEVAVATGFVSASHFSKVYREEFNSKPSKDLRTF